MKLEEYMQWIEDWIKDMETDYGLKETSFTKVKYYRK